LMGNLGVNWKSEMGNDGREMGNQKSGHWAE
jgi:hypothetical protein